MTRAVHSNLTVSWSEVSDRGRVYLQQSVERCQPERHVPGAGPFVLQLSGHDGTLPARRETGAV